MIQFNNKVKTKTKTKTKKYLPTYICILLITFIVATICLFGIGTPVLAEDPTNYTVTIPTAKAFQNVFQTGDILIIFEYDIAYVTTPTVAVSDLFFTQLMAADGITVLTPTDKLLPTYNYNMSAFYFTAADVTALGLVWGTAYYIEIDGTASFAPAFTPVQYQLIAAKWITGIAALTAGYIRTYLIDTLVPDIQTHSGTTYLTSTANGTVLNTAGRILVISAIPYLDTPIPQLFQLAVQQVQVTQPVETGTLQTQLSLSNKLGTQLSTAFTNFGVLLNISGQQVAMGWILICILIVVSIVFLNTGNIVGASICAIPMAAIGMWIGAIPVAFIFTAIMVMVVLLVFYLFIRGM